MSKSEKDISVLCQRLLNCDIGEKAVEVDYEEFKKIYHTLTDVTGKTLQVSLIKTIEGEIFAQFSSLSPQHFLISKPTNLTLHDFDLLPSKVWHGLPAKNETFLRFFPKELNINRWPLLIVFSMSTFLMAIVNNQDLYDLIATLLIQGGTVFISIYLVFTVIQSQNIVMDVSLYARGITQKYYQDDRNITILALVTLASVFLNAMFVYVVLGVDRNNFTPEQDMFFRLVPAASTGTSIAMLLACFLTISQYYLSRTIDIYERDAVSEILHADFIKLHPDESVES